MKNKIKKILFSGILSLVLVFAFAFASLNVLRTDDRAHAESANYTCKGSYDAINYDLVYNLSLDASETTFGALREQLKYAVENQFEHWSVSEIKLYFDEGRNGDSAGFVLIPTEWNNLPMTGRYDSSEEIIYFGVSTLSAPPRQFTGNLGDFTYSFIEDVEISDVRETLSTYLSDNEYDVVVTSLSYGGQELADNAAIGYRGCNTVHPFTYTATITPKQSSQQEEQQSQKKIEFTPVVKYQDGANLVDNEWWLPASNDTTGLGYQVTVEYKVFSNTGINNLVLIPTYDTTVFSIASVTPNNETALGEAEVTGVVGNPTVKKVAWDSETTFSDYSQEDDEVVLLTVVFNVNKAVEVENGYVFGLQLQDGATYNDKSTAHVFEAGKTGEQEAVAISLALSATPENVVRIKTLLPAQIEIGYNTWDNGFTSYEIYYKGTAVNVNKVGALTEVLYSGDEVEYADEVVELYATDKTSVEYTYNGTATVVVKWYQQDGNNWTEMENAPITPGVYRVGISAPAHGKYFAVAETYREVTILKSTVTIKIYNKESVYGDALAQLTHSTVVNGIGIPTETLNVQLATNPASISNVGSYPIVATYTNPNEDLFTVLVNNGTYTITPRPITITAIDQTAKYSGEEPEVDQTQYTVTGVDSNSITGVVITKAPGVNVGEYTLTPSLNNANYDPTCVPAKFYITTVGKNAEYINSFFHGDEVTYDAQSHNLLIVDTLPEWLQGTYAVQNNSNMKTNAGQHTISIKVTLSDQTAANWTNNIKEFNLTVPATINQAALTITAENKTHEYGHAPVDRTSTVVGLQGNDEVTVTYTILNANENAIELSSTTTVGTYTIVPSVTNGNYDIEFVNGEYVVTKTNPVINVVADDVDYNQELIYTVTVTVAGVETDAYTLAVSGNTLPLETILDAGDYTLTVNVPAGTNYNAGSGSDTFTVNPVKLGTPGLSYENGRVTWTAPTADKNGEALLDEPTFTYEINEVEQSGNSYTAGSTAALTLKVTPSNTNYAVTEFPLKDVYQVSFASESVNPDFGGLADLPPIQYIFKGCNVATPVSQPTRTGYTFKAWDPALTTAITEDTTIYATWNIITYTITVVYPVSATTTETLSGDVDYNTKIYAALADLKEAIGKTSVTSTPAEEYDLAGLHYVLKGTWKVTGIEEVSETSLGSGDYVEALGNYTFTAEYTITPIDYELSYKYSYDGATDYSPAGDQPTVIPFGTKINYVTLPNLKWFRFEGWFTNPERTVLAPETMPAGNLTVYGSYVFDIGTGDVNANKEVTTNDITLYRQWIVGGYSMTELTTNAAVLQKAQLETEEPSTTRYFLYRVADVNGDGSRDIRDVSTIRMTLAGGYGWEDENGYNVSGHEVIRNVKTKTFSEVSTALEAGKKVTLLDDVTSESALVVNYPGHVTLDLGGHTLTVAKVDLTVTNRGTLTVKNGTIVTTGGITLRAPYGNVVIDGVTGYDKDGEVNLQAAQNSLHLAGKVKFYKGVDTTDTEEPAAVNVEEGTHVVIEAAAELVVEKLVVTHDVFQTTATAETLTIALNNYSAAVETVVVENGSVKNDNLIYTYEDLVNAGNRDGLYTLMADIDCGSHDVVYNNVNVVLDLNRHNITFASWGFEANLGASLTINGLGTVTAGNACLYSRRNSELVINGGNYVSNDHYVIGTNGNSDQGVSHIVINGGTFTSYITTANKIPCGIYLANNDTLEVNGGTFNIENGVGILARAGHTTVSDKAVFNVTGNGTFGQAGDSKVNIPSGSVLVLDYAANYPAGDPVITNKSTYKVVAVVESEADLQSAFTVADKVVLLADIELTREIVARKNITLDLNNHKLYNTVTIWENEYYDYALIGVTGCTLTIVGDGQVIAKEDDCYAVETWNNGTVVINGGTYAGNCHAVYVYEGAAVINGGYYYIQQLSSNPDPYGYVLNCYDANYKNGTATIVVTGGQFEKFNPADCAAESPRGHFVPEGYRVVEENGVYTVKLSSLVATAEEFVEFVANGGNVTLENDIDLAAQVEVNKDVVLDLNGHTLRYIGQTTLNSGLLAVRRGAILTINDTVGTGKVDASSNNVYAAVALTLAADGATGEVAKVVVNGGTLEGYYYGVVGNGSRHDTEVVVNDGTLYGINGSGIYNPQDGLVTVNGGNVKGLETAIEIRAGELVINGGEFEALATAYTLTGNGSGTTLTGVIIAVSQHTTLKPITVTINDGTFTNGVCAVALVDTTVNTHSDLINVTINGGTFNSVKSATSRTIYVKNGNLIINGGNYNSGPDNNDEGNSTILVDSYGHVTINGGTFRAGAKWGGRYWTLNKYNNVANTTSLLVCGGTYYEFDPSNPNTDDSVTYLAEGYTVTVENEVYTVVEVNN